MSQSVPPAVIARACAHPLRARILETLDGASRSPVALAAELNAPLGNVSYHVQVLRELGAIKLEGTRPARGALEHFYTAVWRVRLEVEPIASDGG